MSFHYFFPSFPWWPNSSLFGKNYSMRFYGVIEIFLWVRSSQTGLCVALITVISTAEIMWCKQDKHASLWSFLQRLFGKIILPQRWVRLQGYEYKTSDSHSTSYWNRRAVKSDRIWRHSRIQPILKSAICHHIQDI